MFKKLIEKLYLKQKGNLAYFDSLTGCYNRNYYERVCLPRYNNSKINIILADINKLKFVNDSYGHYYGDKYIIYVTKLLQRQHKEVIRFGGDEFILFCSDKELAEFIKNNPDPIFFCYGYAKKNGDVLVKKAISDVDKVLYMQKKSLSGENLSKIKELIEKLSQ